MMPKTYGHFYSQPKFGEDNGINPYDQLIDDCCLVGPAEHIKEQLTRWKNAGSRGEIGTMVISATKPEELRLVAEELL